MPNKNYIPLARVGAQLGSCGLALDQGGFALRPRGYLDTDMLGYTALQLNIGFKVLFLSFFFRFFFSSSSALHRRSSTEILS